MKLVFIMLIAVLATAEAKDGRSFVIKSRGQTSILKSSGNCPTRLVLYQKGKAVDSKTFNDSIASITVVDADNDGNEDLAIGIIKASRWSAVKSLKMHLYKIREGRILPLWRSSKLTRNMQDFCFTRDNDTTAALVIEKSPASRFNLIEFQWKYFGMKYVRYVLQDQDSTTVYQKFGNLRLKR